MVVYTFYANITVLTVEDLCTFLINNLASVAGKLWTIWERLIIRVNLLEESHFV
jgi:hypothetical protein